MQWLGLGDRNNCFYHNVCQARTSKNAIRMIIAADGRFLRDLQEIKGEAALHFETFLNSLPINFDGASMEYMQEVVDYRCPTAMAAELVRPVQGEEIKQVLFSMPTNKAPGQMGFQ